MRIPSVPSSPVPCLVLVPNSRRAVAAAAGPLPRWAAWVSDLQRLAAHPRHFVAANNWFDVAYIKYHTGVNPLYIPRYSH